MEVHMKKKYCRILAAVLCVLCLTGCGNVHTYVTYTYNVSTGDSVDIKLDTSDDYQITSDVPFEISKSGQLLSSGTFITADGYQMYADAVGEDENASLLDNGSTDTIEYFMWNYNNSEYNYAILIKDSQTGVLLGNTVSEESAKEVFNRLQISLD